MAGWSRSGGVVHRWISGVLAALLLGAMLAVIPTAFDAARAAPVGFGKSVLSGAVVDRPTSMQFGPDGRLYVAQQDGLIKAFTVTRVGANSYSATATETISHIQSIPNHNDDGAVNSSITTRQVTGLAVTGTAANPVLYVSSSDPRIGGGGTGTDTNLDTNSGVVSRLTRSAGVWARQDLVRGLPRSEENHSPNGMQLDPATNTLYLAQGGNTNQGAPSNNFSLLPEVALSAAILSIDLDAIGSATYDLPTLTDPAVDASDPFGGDDGMNQALLVAGGPVQVFAPGFRNPYDLAITASGRMYTIDNGPNGGWGAIPIGEGPGGACTNGVNEPGTSDGDSLHFVTGAGYYGGHPNPTRGNSANTFNGQSPVPAANPVECDYRSAVNQNGALTEFGSSTNGIVEYTASNFAGEMTGDLLLAGFDNRVWRVKLNATGSAVVLKEAIFSAVGDTPLDITVQSDTGAFPGTIWVADIVANQVVVFEPNDFGGGGGTCAGTDDPGLDEDGDGFSNADEIENGTDPCSSADMPPDADGDKTSDLNDPDDDNDGMPDTSDPFALDPQNGMGTSLPASYTWDNDAPPAGGILNLGFTGLMTNGVDDYEDLFDPEQMTAGGAAGVTTVDAVTSGDALGGLNSQQYGFQFGVPATGAFTAHSRIVAPFNGVVPADFQSMGLFVGTGTQDDYVKVVTAANGGSGGVQVVSEVAGSATTVATAGLGMPGVDAVDLYLHVDPSTATVQASYTVTTGGTTGPRTNVGSAQSVPAGWFGAGKGIAVGIVSTSRGATPFAATWDLLEALSDATTPPPPGAVVPPFRVNAGGQEIAGTPPWTRDTGSNPSPHVNAATAGNQTGYTNTAIDLSDPSVPAGTPQIVFQRERLDPATGAEMLWSFPVTPGEYTVRLYFAEIVNKKAVVGARVFDVLAEGGVVLDDFDVFTEAGAPYRGIVRSFTVQSDGTLDVEFRRVVDDPAINAIEILPGATTPPPPPPAGLSATPATVSFGTVAVGSSAQASVVLTNTGTTGAPAITVDATTITGTGAAAYGDDFNDAGSVVLAPGASTTVTVTYTPPAAGSHSAALDITHDGTNTPLSVPLTGTGGTTTPPPPSDAVVPPFRVNAGGQEIAGTPPWTRDTGSNPSPHVNAATAGNQTGYTNTAIDLSDPSVPAGTPQIVFQRERLDPATGAEMLWSFPVTPGEYTVRLYFAEIVNKKAVVGARVFDVLAEGGVVLDDFDVFTEAGAPYRGIVRSFTVQSDGTLDVEFRRVVDDPAINAIEILPGATTPPPPPPAGLSATPATVSFGTVAVGSSAQASVVLTNTGTTGAPAITVDATTITGTGAAAYGDDFNDAGSVVLAPGASTTVTVTYTPPAAGSHSAALDITHDGTNTPLSVPLTGTGGTTTPPPPSDAVVPPFRVNAGGQEIAGTPPWTRDTGSNPSPHVNAATAGNQTGYTNTAIDLSDPSVPAGTPQIVFQRERLDPATGAEMLWSFPVTPGEYTVRLYFAEIVNKKAVVGARVFDVLAEGGVVLDDFDVFTEAGAPYRGIVRSFTVQSDGTLDVEFRRVVDDPAINAIEILPGATTPPPPPPAGLSATPATVSFGTVAVGSSAQASVVLTNTGTTGAPAITVDATTITGTGAAAYGDDFNDAGSVVLAPGASTTVTVTYTPPAAGSHSAALDITHDGTNTPLSVPLTGTGGTTTPPAGESLALIEVNTGESLESSSFTAGSFRITNQSGQTRRITGVRYDLRTALLPDLVFDPNGTAGDATAKTFTPDSGAVATGLSTHAFSSAHDGGFDVLDVSFANFDPGEVLTFSVDIDPTSIKGASSPGPNDSGSVSGLELTGATVTVTYDDGSSQVARLFRTAGSLGHSHLLARPGNLGAPTISVVGVSAPAVVTTASQTVRIAGQAGATVRLLVVEAGLYEPTGGGFDIDPFEANTAVRITEHLATIGTGGTVDVPVTLTMESQRAGLNYMIATLVGADGQTELTSNVVVLDLQ